MKRTKIHYKIVGDSPHNIKITGWDNAATPNELQREFGNKVVDEYLRSNRRIGPRYYGYEGYLSIITIDGYYSLYRGAFVSRDQLDKAIVIMKQAGKRLQRIVQEETTYTVII